MPTEIELGLRELEARTEPLKPREQTGLVVALEAAPVQPTDTTPQRSRLRAAQQP